MAPLSVYPFQKRDKIMAGQKLAAIPRPTKDDKPENSPDPASVMATIEMLGLRQPLPWPSVTSPRHFCELVKFDFRSQYLLINVSNHCTGGDNQQRINGRHDGGQYNRNIYSDERIMEVNVPPGVLGNFVH